MSEQNPRPEGGIEPLCLSTPTGLKPAPQTTEDHLDNKRRKLMLFCSYWPVGLAIGTFSCPFNIIGIICAKSKFNPPSPHPRHVTHPTSLHRHCTILVMHTLPSTFTHKHLIHSPYGFRGMILFALKLEYTCTNGVRLSIQGYQLSLNVQKQL